MTDRFTSDPEDARACVHCHQPAEAHNHDRACKPSTPFQRQAVALDREVARLQASLDVSKRQRQALLDQLQLVEASIVRLEQALKHHQQEAHRYKPFLPKGGR